MGLEYNNSNTITRKHLTGPSKQIPRIVISGGLLDLVQWPIEPTTTIHVLPPRPHFLNLRSALLVPFNVFSLGRTETSYTHHGRHSFVILVGGVHGLPLFLVLLVIIETFALDACLWDQGDRPFFQPWRRLGRRMFWDVSIPRIVPVAVAVIPSVVSSTIFSVSSIRIPSIVVTIAFPVPLQTSVLIIPSRTPGTAPPT